MYILQTYTGIHRGKITGVTHKMGALFTCSTDKTLKVHHPTRKPDLITTLTNHRADIAGVCTWFLHYFIDSRKPRLLAALVIVGSQEQHPSVRLQRFVHWHLDPEERRGSHSWRIERETRRITAFTLETPAFTLLQIQLTNTNCLPYMCREPLL